MDDLIGRKANISDIKGPVIVHSIIPGEPVKVIVEDNKGNLITRELEEVKMQPVSNYDGQEYCHL